MQATDPERNFIGHLCASGDDGCAGDVRLYDWQAKGYGIVQPVLFTARSGATISGPRVGDQGRARQAARHRHHQRLGPGPRAALLVRRADAREGRLRRADLGPAGPGAVGRARRGARRERGIAGADRRPPVLRRHRRTRSTSSCPRPSTPYEPRPSCESGTSHAAKQNRRVAAGLNAAYNPFWQLLNPSRIGIAGHSFGAAGVSFVGQKDPRVSAIVAWDNLGAPEHHGRPAGEAVPGRPGQPRRPHRSPSRRSGCRPTTA